MIHDFYIDISNNHIRSDIRSSHLIFQNEKKNITLHRLKCKFMLAVMYIHFHTLYTICMYP